MLSAEDWSTDFANWLVAVVEWSNWSNRSNQHVSLLGFSLLKFVWQATGHQFSLALNHTAQIVRSPKSRRLWHVHCKELACQFRNCLLAKCQLSYQHKMFFFECGKQQVIALIGLLFVQPRLSSLPNIWGE